MVDLRVTDKESGRVYEVSTSTPGPKLTDVHIRGEGVDKNISIPSDKNLIRFVASLVDAVIKAVIKL